MSGCSSLVSWCSVSQRRRSRSPFAAPSPTSVPISLAARAITRTEAAVRPDRREIDYQLLAEPAGATSTGAPEQIQILGPHGVPQFLADIDGADCALQRFVVLRSGLQVALITARRSSDPALVDLSSPAPVDIQVYRQEGGDPGEASPIFVADGDVHHAGPLCEAKAMQQAIDRVAAAVFSAKGQRS